MHPAGKVRCAGFFLAVLPCRISKKCDNAAFPLSKRHCISAKEEYGVYAAIDGKKLYSKAVPIGCHKRQGKGSVIALFPAGAMEKSNRISNEQKAERLLRETDSSDSGTRDLE